MNKKSIICSSICLLIVVLGAFYYFFFASLSSKKETMYVNIDGDDTIDSVYTKITQSVSPHQMLGFKLMSSLSGYKNHVRTGHYEITRSTGSFTLFRKMKNGRQTPVKLTIPSVRTNERLAAELGKKLMADSAQFIKFLRDSVKCQTFGCDTATILCLFIPNTYEVYWNIPVEKFMKRMKEECDAFWTATRVSQAKAAGLTPKEVYILASIIDEETANNAEKPDIAGMYLNRLHQGMPLQADPTIKFATRQFQLRRIYENLLFVNSPYNTYRNVGLPIGPIRIPSLAGINAVLNYSHHNYIYMCAKEDFSGTHRFASTYAEHLNNAKRYSEALNQRGIH